MIEKRKRLLALLMTLVMLLSLLPTTAFAEDEVKVKVSCSAPGATVTVYEKNVNGEAYEVQCSGDEYYHILPGTYYYTAAADGYAYVDMTPFTVSTEAEQTVSVTMTPIQVKTEEEQAQDSDENPDGYDPALPVVPGTSGTDGGEGTAVTGGIFNAHYGRHQVFGVWSIPAYPTGTQNNPDRFTVSDLAAPFNLALGEEDYFYFVAKGPASRTGVVPSNRWNAAAEELNPYTVALHVVKHTEDGEENTLVGTGVIGAFSAEGFLFETGGETAWFSNVRGYPCSDTFCAASITYTPVANGRLVCDVNLLTGCDAQSMLPASAVHEHVWNVEAEGGTAVYTCTAEGCPFETDKEYTMSLFVPAGRGAKAEVNKLCDGEWPAVLEQDVVYYSGRGETEYARSTTPPTAEGTYTAEVSVGYRLNTAVLTVDYAIGVEEPAEEETPGFDRTESANGIVVTVKAAAEVFPEDAVLSVAAVETNEDIEAAVAALRDEERGAVASAAVEVKIIDGEGNLLLPAEGNSVSVSLSLAEPAEEGLEAGFYRIASDGEGNVIAEVQPADENGVAGDAVAMDGSLVYVVELTAQLTECMKNGHVWCEDNGYDPVTCLVCGELKAIADGGSYNLEFDNDRWIALGDPEADAEDASVWEAMFGSVTLTGSWPEDLVTVAASQIGYTESVRNYAMNADRERRGYTRYGAWYGVPYGEWNEMFAAFCLNYAGVTVPFSTDSAEWAALLEKSGMFGVAAEYQPKAGDLVFLDSDYDSVTDSVAIIWLADVYAGVLQVIEGNVNGMVVSYELGTFDGRVKGYGILPECATPEPMQFSETVEGLEVTVDAPAGAFPERTVMTLALTEQEGVMDALQEALGRHSAIENFKAFEVAFFLDEEEVLPEAALQITVRDEEFTGDAVLRVEDGAAAVVETAAGEEDGALSFESESGGTFALVQGNLETTITATASDGASVEITGLLPEEAEASITPVRLSKSELVQIYGKSLVEAVDDFVVYDICILVNGEEWEPDETVSVVVKNPAIEVKESNEEVSVTHLGEDMKSSLKVAKEITEEGDIAFEADSFSLWGFYTYTVDYYLNDNEYHQPGNTGMLLSELFVPLLVDIPVSEVTDVEFTDYTLLQIDRLEEEEDFLITSLKPFTSQELMKITFTTGDWLTIVVEDLLYASYTYEASQLKPYTGSFNYVGHFNIFGGGNGIPSIVRDETNSGDDWEHWWAGEYGGNSSWNSDTYTTAVSGIRVHLPMLQGRAVGNDQNGQPLEAESNKYKSGSSAEITWSGNLKQAFFSFSWLYYFGSASNKTHAIFDVKLYAPNGDYTTVVLNTDSETNDPRPNDSIVGNDTTDAWRMLSFDATAFVGAHGQGAYTVIVEISPTPGNTTIGSYLSDMGFTIFGVTADPSQPVSAVVGVVDEIMISHGSSDLANRAAVVMLEKGVTPRGKGKAWFNCQGGEYISTSSGSEVDRDYLELMTPKPESTTDYNYLKLGEGGAFPIPGWNAEDIASPNHNQTPPFGLGAYSNRCSFGLGEFSGLQNTAEIVGVRKSMARGNDCFGSLMMLIEVMPTSDEVEVTKMLGFDGNGVTTTLPESGVERTLTFDIAPLNGAPAPTKTHYEVNFPADAGNAYKLLFEMGTFEFKNLSGDGPWDFVYDVTEGTTVNMAPWTYDTRTLQLHFHVIVDEENGTFKVDGDPYWTVKGNDADPDNFFKNGYVLPTALEVEKVDIKDDPVAGAKFMLYKNADCTTPADVFIDEAMTTALTASNAPVTGSDGLAHFYGIDKDNSPYYLKEVDAPGGYILDDTVVTITYVSGEDGGYWVYQTDEAEEPTILVTSVSDTTDLGTISLTRVNNEYVDIKVIKNWNDNDNQPGIRPGSVTIGLTGSDGNSYTLTLDGTSEEKPGGTAPAKYENPDWTANFIYLPKYTGDGTAITYTVQEISVPTGYSVSYSPANREPGDDNTVTITNTPETVEVSAAKVWNDNNNEVGIRPTSIQLQLYRQVGAGENTATGDPVTIDANTAPTAWSKTWTGLPKYGKNSTDNTVKEITYSVDETAVPTGYTKEVTHEGNSYTITNTHIPETTEVSGVKKWDDEGNKDKVRPASVTVILLADGEQAAKAAASEGEAWAFSFDNLPKYRFTVEADGSVTKAEIKYTVDEKDVPKYEKEITKNSDGTFTITNRYKPSPKTGDNTIWWAWLTALILSGSTLVTDTLLRYRKKRNRSARRGS